MKPEKLLIFDIKGFFAHFRKYYTNVSSLSYSTPPRTVISGLIAGILGKSRDSYYDDFNVDNTTIGVSIRVPVKKMMHTINFYNLKYINYSLRSQVPLEIVSPFIRSETVCYRIYFYNEKCIDELKERIKNKRYVYNPYLGITEFLADIEYVDFINDESIVPLKPNDSIEILSCFKKFYINKILMSNTIDNNIKYNIERMPVNFNTNRELHLFDDYIFVENCKPIKAVLKENTEVFEISYLSLSKNITENIIFME